MVYGRDLMTLGDLTAPCMRPGWQSRRCVRLPINVAGSRWWTNGKILIPAGRIVRPIHAPRSRYVSQVDRAPVDFEVQCGEVWQRTLSSSDWCPGRCGYAEFQDGMTRRAAVWFGSMQPDADGVDDINGAAFFAADLAFIARHTRASSICLDRAAPAARPAVCYRGEVPAAVVMPVHWSYVTIRADPLRPVSMSCVAI